MLGRMRNQTRPTYREALALGHIDEELPRINKALGHHRPGELATESKLANRGSADVIGRLNWSHCHWGQACNIAFLSTSLVSPWGQACNIAFLSTVRYYASRHGAQT
jgi:hypothetical protein